MKLLLDTHIFLWINSEPEKLSATVHASCENPENQLYLSLVSPWEIQIKQQLGKLQLGADLLKQRSCDVFCTFRQKSNEKRGHTR